ncbi:FAD-dependent thymidylate synthase [Parachlamydia sp. AcF125]|uniref:FAD-dependent thymidylate synthase n=1 Tax=Parachlamydia sp. AcF125 TaxID=2795736 RepID=UPI001BC97217|nr:FAD-dependent thymidylate synthase [Parachlamydia sp. AcF125]MBS4167903.1 Thymidylate synthase ThyX [Parachlamydia sp. AcF125]
MLLDDYEEFSESQLKILERYVTNTHSHVFVLRNLPEVIKGALFSRYSRSTLGLRTLLLKEFIANNEESAFAAIAGGESGETSEWQNAQTAAIRKAQNFYDRILDGYGDDSIGELGGAHLAIENISMIAAKLIEDARIGGSPLEKSTRYVYFDQKVKGENLFYKEPILMTSAYRDLYVNTCNMLFDTYSKLIPPLTTMIEEKMPKDQATSKSAYAAAVRAKVLDCLRGLLPAGTLTNMGIFGNGRFYEQLIHKMHCNNLAELQDLGKRTYEELGKVIPSFIRRADLFHHTHQSFARYYEAMQAEIAVVTAQNTNFPERMMEPGVRLLSSDSEAVVKVAAALLFAHSDKGYHDLLQYCRKLPEEGIARILDAACSARENRRHKSPRALEHANFTFEMVTDFGVYRDLHRHRLLTQERQFLSCDYGFYVPPELVGTELEEPYLQALHAAKEAYDTMSTELPEEAQYVVPMAYNVRWYFHVNLRALQWICELRSAAAGHAGYRFIAQEMAKKVSQAFPQFERFFKFVDFEGYDLGRLDQEIRKEEKQLRQ